MPVVNILKFCFNKIKLVQIKLNVNIFIIQNIVDYYKKMKKNINYMNAN